MMFEPASSRRVSVQRNAEATRIDVRAERGLAAVGFSLLFLYFWTLAGNGLLSPAFSSAEGFGYALLGYIFYACLWVFGEVMMLASVIWMLFGREILTIGSDVVRKRVAVPVYGKSWDYDPAEIRNVRRIEISDPKSRKYIGGQRVVARFPLGERGDVAFNYGEQTVYFGYYLEPAEADLIVDTIVDRLGESARAAA